MHGKTIAVPDFQILGYTVTSTCFHWPIVSTTCQCLYSDEQWGWWGITKWQDKTMLKLSMAKW